MVLIVFALLPLLCAPLFVLAFPISPDNLLSRRARSLAFDEVERRYIAFDFEGRELGTYSAPPYSQKRDAPATGSCQTLSSDDVKKCVLFSSPPFPAFQLS